MNTQNEEEILYQRLLQQRERLNKETQIHRERYVEMKRKLDHPFYRVKRWIDDLLYRIGL